MKTMHVTVTVVGKKVTVNCPDTDVKTGSGNVNLKWVMDTEGWEITGVPGLDPPEFINKKKEGKGYKCVDKNDTLGDFPYTITVEETSTKTKVAHDPTIRNGGPDILP